MQVQPKYHLFGHLHDEPLVFNNGIKKIQNIDTNFVNASIVNLSHKPVNKPFKLKL